MHLGRDHKVQSRPQETLLLLQTPCWWRWAQDKMWINVLCFRLLGAQCVKMLPSHLFQVLKGHRGQWGVLASGSGHGWVMRHVVLCDKSTARSLCCLFKTRQTWQFCCSFHWLSDHVTWRLLLLCSNAGFWFPCVCFLPAATAATVGWVCHSTRALTRDLHLVPRRSALATRRTLQRRVYRQAEVGAQLRTCPVLSGRKC